MYDPTVGRFLQEDTIGIVGGDTNYYRYCGNEPITNTDPTGLCKEDCCCCCDMIYRGEKDDVIYVGIVGPWFDPNDPNNQIPPENKPPVRRLPPVLKRLPPVDQPPVTRLPPIDEMTPRPGQDGTLEVIPPSDLQPTPPRPAPQYPDIPFLFMPWIGDALDKIHPELRPWLSDLADEHLFTPKPYKGKDWWTNPWDRYPGGTVAPGVGGFDFSFKFSLPGGGEGIFGFDIKRICPGDIKPAPGMRPPGCLDLGGGTGLGGGAGASGEWRY
ncbi:MAG: hypothetical protein GX594_08825 [Pirellulaceae bacterium]|nr:hypothetical protein [Pirellulaceae bacterium]